MGRGSSGSKKRSSKNHVSLPELKGSEKQVQWATQIRNNVFETLNQAESQRYDKLYTIDSALDYLSPEAVKALRSEYEAGFNKIDSAAKIIDLRDKFRRDAVIKHGRDWMWHHGQRNSRGTLPR